MKDSNNEDKPVRGRPRIKIDITDELLNNIEKWTAEGYSVESIGLKINITRNVWIKLRKEHPELQQAIERGRWRDEQLCKNRLRAIAFDDNHKNHLTALLAYGKIMHRWNDGSRLDEAVAATQMPKSIPTNLDDDKEND